jgi:hypothetical protein
MKYESFSFSPQEMGAELTRQSHQVLAWLNRNGYLDNEDTVDLLSRMIVVPVSNQKNFGQRMLDRFFGRDQEENCYVFPVTLLEELPEQSDDVDKPTLTVVK